MSSLNALTLDTLEMLYGSAPFARPSEDTVYSTVAAAGTTEVRMSTPSMWHRGDYMEYWSGTGSVGEIILHTEDHSDGKTTTVRRGQRRTSASGGFSAGDVFLRNPIWPVVTVQRALSEVIVNDLGPDVWFRSKRSFTPVAGQKRYAANDADYMVEAMYQYDLNSLSTHDPFPYGWYEIVTDVDTGEETTGRVLRVFHWYDTTADVYYTARTRPTVADVASFPTELVDMIPWGAAARLLPTLATAIRIDPTRSGSDMQRPSQPYTDAEYYRSRFEDMKKAYRRMLLREKNIHPRFKRSQSRIVRG